MEKKKIGRPLYSEKPMRTTSFRLAEDELEQFEEYCKQQGKPKSKILRDFVLSVIKKK